MGSTRGKPTLEHKRTAPGRSTLPSPSLANSASCPLLLPQIGLQTSHFFRFQPACWRKDASKELRGVISSWLAHGFDTSPRPGAPGLRPAQEAATPEDKLL